MICFYRNTIDSCACANLLSSHMKVRDKDCFIEYKGFKNMNIELPENEEVWLVGIPLTENDYPYIDNMINRKNKIIWYDNHESSLLFQQRHDSLSSLDIEINLSRSSSMHLFLQLNCSVPCPNIPYYIRLINDYEKWSIGDDIIQDSFAFTYGMMKEDRHPISPIWDTFIYSFQTAHNIRQDGNIILGYIKKITKSCIESMSYISEFKGRRYLCVNQQIHHDIIPNINRCNLNVVSWYFDGTNYQYTISTRSKVVDLMQRYSEFDDMRGNRNCIQFTSNALLFPIREG